LRWSWALAAYLTFPLVLGAALWLARSSYRHAEEVAARAAGREREANRALAGQIIRRVDAAIIDADRTLFNLIDLERPREFERLWRRIVKVSKSVEAIAVLNDSREVLHFLTGDRKERASLKGSFLDQIVPDLELDDLGPDGHKHLHKNYDGKSKFVSYFRSDSSDGGARYVALDWRVNHLVEHLVGRTVREELGPRRRSRRFAVVDEQGDPVFGEVGDAAGAYEVRFPTTFYRWRLRMAPRFPNPDAVAAGQRAKSELALVGVSTVVTVAGLLLLGFSVRKERRIGKLHSDFTANLSHELKTPLSLIRMFSELIALGKLKEVRRFA
jgi:two-component system phosphate regulon sensor histidine kinase PhoR